MTSFICAAFDVSNFLFAFLLALAGVLTVAICVLAGMYVQRKNADTKRQEKHVYVRETWIKNVDSANIAKKNTKKQKENSTPKKLRHGKKNKLAKAKNEADK